MSNTRTPSLLSSTPSRQVSINDMRGPIPSERTPLVSGIDAVETESVPGMEQEEVLAG